MLMRRATTVAVALIGAIAGCGGAPPERDPLRDQAAAAADSAFRADSATLAGIVESDAAERRAIAATRMSSGFAPYRGGEPALPDAFSSREHGGTTGSTAATDAGIRALTTYEAADLLRTRKGQVSVAILYGTRCPRSKAMFPGFVALQRRYQGQPVQVDAFAIDHHAEDVPAFLAEHHAPFDPLFILPRKPGDLIGALAPL